MMIKWMEQVSTGTLAGGLNRTAYDPYYASLTIGGTGNGFLSGSALAVGGDMSISSSTDNIVNQGNLYSQGQNILRTPGALINTGSIMAESNVSVSVNGVNSSGTISAGFNSDGTLNSASTLTIVSGDKVTLGGNTLSSGNISINVGNHAGLGPVTNTVYDLINSGIISAGNQTGIAICAPQLEGFTPKGVGFTPKGTVVVSSRLPLLCCAVYTQVGWALMIIRCNYPNTRV